MPKKQKKVKVGPNFKLKVGLALANMIKNDKDLWIKAPNENAFNSNLCRGIRKIKDHTVEMEYDCYNFRMLPILLSNTEVKDYITFKIQSSKKGVYSPKPDIISHKLTAKGREETSIKCVVECKFNGNLEGIKQDFYKLLAYKLLFNATQTLLVVYPAKKSSIPKYPLLRKTNVWNWEFLEEQLKSLSKDDGAVFEISLDINQIASSFPELNKGKFLYKELDEKDSFSGGETKSIIIKSDENYQKFVVNNQNELFSVIVNENVTSEEKSGKFNGPEEILGKPKFDFSDKARDFLNKLSEDISSVDGVINKILYKRGAVLLNENYEKNYKEHKPYDSLRNLYVMLKQGENFVIMLHKVKGLELKGMEKIEHKYSDSKNSTWDAYKTIENSNNFQDFERFILENKELIIKAVILKMESIKRDGGIHWSESKRMEFDNLLKVIRSIKLS